VSVTPQLKELILTAADQFRHLNRSQSLSAADKKQLKTFFLEQILAPQMGNLLRQTPNGPILSGRTARERMAAEQMLTAKDVQAWLKIKPKTVYYYANQRLIPHIRISGTVRFPAQALQKWIARCMHIPPEMITGRRGTPRRIAGRWRTRKARRTH
jgi:predicted DNA-binding transcriptional regulator AlpA